MFYMYVCKKKTYFFILGWKYQEWRVLAGSDLTGIAFVMAGVTA